MKITALLSLALLAGCTTVTYSDGTGRSVSVTRFATSTTVGHLEAHASDGTSLLIDQYDSQSQAVQLAGQVVSLAGTLASRPSTQPAKP